MQPQVPLGPRGLSPPVWPQVDSLHPLSCASLCVCHLSRQTRALCPHWASVCTASLQRLWPHCSSCIQGRPTVCTMCRTPSRAEELGKSPQVGLVCTSTASTPHLTGRAGPGRAGRALEGLRWRVQLSGAETPNTQGQSHSARVFCGSRPGSGASMLGLLSCPDWSQACHDTPPSLPLPLLRLCPCQL